MPSHRHRELIALELSSLFQQLAHLRGDGKTPAIIPPAECAVIASFGLACCRLSAGDARARDASRGTYGFTADGDYNRTPSDAPDEDTLPSYRPKKE